MLHNYTPMFWLTWLCSCTCLALNSSPDEFHCTWFTKQSCVHLCLLLEEPEVKENKTKKIKPDGTRRKKKNIDTRR